MRPRRTKYNEDCSKLSHGICWHIFFVVGNTKIDLLTRSIDYISTCTIRNFSSFLLSISVEEEGGMTELAKIMIRDCKYDVS